MSGLLLCVMVAGEMQRLKFTRQRADRAEPRAQQGQEIQPPLPPPSHHPATAGSATVDGGTSSTVAP